MQSIPGKNNDRTKIVASYFLSLSLFAIAGAIIYFTYVLTVISQHIPEVLLKIDTTTEKIEPILDEVAVITALVPSILEEVKQTRKMIPPILVEIQQTRKIIPSLLREVEQTRNQIPAVLKESAAIRRKLPTILSSANKASAAVVGVTKQIEASRPLIAEVLQEVETTRESIPPMMDRADSLIDKARIAGKEASQGAITGIFSGIIMAPFSLLADAGQGIVGLSAEDAKKFSKKDFSLIEQAALRLLNTGSVNDEESWNNTESKRHGDIVLTKIYNEGEYSEIECRALSFKLFEKDKALHASDRSFCQTDDGKWDFDTD